MSDENVFGDMVDAATTRRAVAVFERMGTGQNTRDDVYQAMLWLLSQMPEQDALDALGQLARIQQDASRQKKAQQTQENGI